MIPSSLQTWWSVGGGESAAGSLYFNNAITARQTGDFNTAYNQFNYFMLFGLQKLTQPLYNVLLSTTNRTTGVGDPGHCRADRDKLRQGCQRSSVRAS